MASIALLFYNFPPTFGKVDVREFLHLFGLEVDRLGTRRGSVCAVVLLSTEAEVRLVIARLHQLLLGKYRLKVEYCDGKKKAKLARKSKIEATVGSEAAVKRQKAIESVLQRGAMQTFEGFPPSSILYQYPKISPATLDNIARELTSNGAFYYQVLHLMNKMNLKPPFAVQDEARNTNSASQENSSLLLEDEESELESELESDTENTGPTRKKVKLNSSLPLPKTMKVMNYAPDTQPQVVQNQPKPSKLKIHISGSFLTSAENESEQVVNATERPEDARVPVPTSEPSSCPPTDEPVDATGLTVEDILSNRIPEEQRASLNVFQNYAAGDPSGKLYIKNLAKQVTEQDLTQIYQLFHDKAVIQSIDVKLMKTGRMKGQAFVSFLPVDEDSPSEVKQFAKCIATALSATNGYILKDKPMVVSYAKNTKS
ncbi:RNA-binding region-containing protein 3 [Anopheles aquasalis]|uniref:RNA-binding region-containing protein 3 n=1 Tax=Anopheles aquasalis TaxID=42839 RepID=UPI00215ADE7C|nr:RNA-binding region-containing protein 3 [Anopheles aquasalis]